MCVSSPAAEEKGEAETACDELTTAGAGEDIKKIRSEVGPEIKGGLEGRCFKGFIFLLPYSDLISNK